MEYKDYYKILGVDKKASQDEIKRAYRKLARKYHPDVSKEANAEDKFKDLQEAYEVLKDPEKRAAYDQLGSYRSGQDFRPPPGWGESHQWTGGAGAQGGASPGGGFSDFFETLFGMGGRGGFQGHPGFAGRGYSSPGEDFEVAFSVTLDEAFHGTQKSVHLEIPEMQPDGRVVRVPRQIQVRIPKGVTDGQRLRLAGQGGKGFAGGPPGDLYLRIRLEAHPFFKVQEHDLLVDLPLAPWEAALGTSVEVPTLDGRVRIKVPAGVKCGQKMRLAGKGLPLPGNRGSGDLYAVLQIAVPKSLTGQERSLFEELARSSSFNPREDLEGV
ncbi:DnaJ C-terminal domain-containing protein [Thermithiobacillus plumbiphilus]|uniref:DnaJ C-terminal domain-containing protein n=1 Tax=Thermithiobacillus plumbiphilus TaxID=1729899 RepID=A0ABU9D7V6_9PROT